MTRDLSASFMLPMPPSTNQLYINVPGKGRAKSKPYRAWVDEAGWEMKRQVLASGDIVTGMSLPHLVGDVEMTITLPGSSRIDVDNIKALPDLMQRMGVLDNDKQIKLLHVIASSGVVGTCCELHLRCLVDQ